jgi:glycosyltransferase involved in cell wall biosynthesis
MDEFNAFCPMSSSKAHDFKKTETCKWCGCKPKDRVENKFKILITAYNAGQWLEKSINSVLSQTYRNFDLYVIDDCSTDNSRVILNKLQVPHSINEKRLGKMENCVNGYKALSKDPEDILIELDGDDWLADNTVLEYLNKIYQDPNIWLTYGQFKDLAGKIPDNYSKPLERTDNYRANYKPGMWQTSALRTFKHKVWSKVKDEDLRGKDGKYYQWTNDIFRMFPMIEMCGPKRIKCCNKVLYIYNNMSPINESRVNPKLQLEIAKELSQKPTYQELPNEVVASIVIPAYKRGDLLKFVLPSLVKQQCKYSFEVIVLNDGIEDNTKGVCDLYKNKLNIKYVFTGQRNKEVLHWRIPGFAINIGTKIAGGKILIIMDSEIFLLDNCLETMITVALKDPKNIVVTQGKWDGKKEMLTYLENKGGELGPDNPYNKMTHPLRTELPFFMAINKEQFCSIGGYDEDFIGHSFDDSDIVRRLLQNGGKYEKLSSRIVHLYHPTTEQKIIKDPVVGKGFDYNKELSEARKNILVRNVGREWGTLNPTPDLSNGWYLKSIPRIVHFYWGNRTLPYLRYLTIYSFYKYNPDWKIKVYRATKPTTKKTWGSTENKYEFGGGCYWYKLEDLDIEIIDFDMSDIGVSNNIAEVFKSEYLKNYLSTEYGGLWSDMDIIYFESMNKLSVNIKENENVTNVISIHEVYGHSVGFTLAAPKNEYHDFFLEQAKKGLNEGAYQCIGPDMVNKHAPYISTISQKFPRTTAVNMAIDSIYAYDYFNIDKIYESSDMSRYTEHSIGLHWYGGYTKAGKFVNELTPYNYKQYENVLCKTIALV